MKVNYQQILQFISTHPMEFMVLIAFFTALQSKNKQQINKAAKQLVGVVATDINTSDPDVKKALSDLSAALSK